MLRLKTEIAVTEVVNMGNVKLSTVTSVHMNANTIDENWNFGTLSVLSAP